MRLDKYLSLALVGTRKKVKEYIYSGAVTVDDDVIQEPAFDVVVGKHLVTYLDQPLDITSTIYYLFHKPAGCITIKHHPTKTTIFDYFKDIDTTALFPAGRLDKDTEGLLILTNDGTLTHQLMSPTSHVPKTYYFIARGVISDQNMSSIEKGVIIDSGQLTKPAQLTHISNGYYPDHEKELLEHHCKMNGADLSLEPVVTGYLTISEGMKHQVKKMLKTIHCTVIYLKRVSIGHMELDDTLAKGSYLQLTQEELISRVLGDPLLLERSE